MAEILYYRYDLPLAIRSLTDGEVQLRLAEREARLTATAIADWTTAPAGVSPPPVQAAFAQLDLPAQLATLQAEAALQSPPVNSPWQVLTRVALQIANVELAALPWEAAVWNSLGAGQMIEWPQLVVRTTPVRPRVAALPLTFPLRILQVDPWPNRLLEPSLRQVFGDTPDELMARVVQVDECRLEDLHEWREGSKWPTAEIIHFDRFPGNPTRLLESANTEAVGSLGWLWWLADTWQTRLLVFHCRPEELADARRLAAALVARGGPAVLVGELLQNNIDSFYDWLVHDIPLDRTMIQMIETSFGFNPGLVPAFYPALFVGAGRSDMVRVSTIGRNLIELAGSLRKEATTEERRRIEELGRLRGQVRGAFQSTRYWLIRSLGENLDDLAVQWPRWRFDHESRGLLPLGEVIQRMRDVAGVGTPQAMTAKAALAGPRYVNASLWGEDAYSRLQQLPQNEAQLRHDEIVHLGIQIGPADETVRTLGAEMLLEEVFKWTPEMEGVWLDIGVTGIDFEVLGDPVQSLWLPRAVSSEFVYFAVIPQVAGAALLRFTIYYGNTVIQSFRLAAIVVEPGVELVAAQAALAERLDVSPEMVGQARYLPRLEYSLAGVDETAGRPERRLSIVANQASGQPIITVKGNNYFDVHIPGGNLPNRVDQARQLFDEISGDTDYAFVESDNSGYEHQIKESLEKLATAGWRLFDILFPGGATGQRKELARLLDGQGETIQVAHILLDHVIPWCAVYDCKYDPDRVIAPDRTPVAHDTCLAPLSHDLWHTACGTHPDCIRHPDRLAERRAQSGETLLEETVACPRHFWGYRHRVELPPHAVADPQKGAPPQIDCVLTAQHAQLVAGFNAILPHAGPHWQRLQQVAAAGKAAWLAKESHRDLIIYSLDDPDLHLIYFYCHARDDLDPYLEFAEDDTSPPGRITADAFDSNQMWGKHPLVFLNGCQTVGYSPRALSHFVRKLVQDRGAAGVVGTEVAVWEPLATFVAESFLELFLAGKTAGEALLQTRRELLERKNPLGLVYTLYAADQLALDRDDDGQCH